MKYYPGHPYYHVIAALATNPKAIDLLLEQDINFWQKESQRINNIRFKSLTTKPKNTKQENKRLLS